MGAFPSASLRWLKIRGFRMKRYCALTQYFQIKKKLSGFHSFLVAKMKPPHRHYYTIGCAFLHGLKPYRQQQSILSSAALLFGSFSHFPFFLGSNPFYAA